MMPRKPIIQIPSLGVDLQTRQTLPIDIPRLIETRLLIEANSGGGKSWAIRRLLEQTAASVQQIVLDSEGDFSTLREKFPYIVAAPHDGDVLAIPKTATILAQRLLEIGVSAIIDIYDLKANERVEFVRLFLEALINAPKSRWHPIMIVLDEAHQFGPQDQSAESVDAVIDLATRGRKRGFGLVCATQRLALLHKSVAAEMRNTLIGMTTLDVDVRRAASVLGFSFREAMQKLRGLQEGEFFAFGPALSQMVTLIKTGAVQTTHPKAGHQLAAPPAPTDEIRIVLAKLRDLPKEAEKQADPTDRLRERVKVLEQDNARLLKGQSQSAAESIFKNRDPEKQKSRSPRASSLSCRRGLRMNLKEVIHRLSGSEGVTVTEDLKSFGVYSLACDSPDVLRAVKELYSHLSDSHLGVVEVHGKITGLLDVRDATLEEVQKELIDVVITKDVSDTWAFFFTILGLSKALRENKRFTSQARAIWVLEEFQTFSTLSTLYSPWSGPREFPQSISDKLENPRRLVRDLTQSRTPGEIAPWLLKERPEEESEVFNAWRQLATEKLVFSIPTEIAVEDGKEIVRIRGTRTLNVTVDISAVSDRSSLFDIATEAATWVYELKRESESKLLFLNEHLSQAWNNEEKWPEGLISTLSDSLANARTSFAFHLREESKDALTEAVKSGVVYKVNVRELLLSLEDKLAQLSAIREGLSELRNLEARLPSAVTRLAAITLKSTTPQLPSHPIPASPVAANVPPLKQKLPISKAGDFRILQALAVRHPHTYTRAQLGALAGISPNSGTFSTYISKLTQLGYIEKSGSSFQITVDGLIFVGDAVPPTPKTHAEVMEQWRRPLKGAYRMLETIVSAGAAGISKEEIGAAMGISHDSGTFSTYLSTLRSRSLITWQNKRFTASDILFP